MINDLLNKLEKIKKKKLTKEEELDSLEEQIIKIQRKGRKFAQI